MSVGEPRLRLRASIGAAGVGLCVVLAAAGWALLGVPGTDGYDVAGALLATALVSLPLVGRALLLADSRPTLGWALLLSGTGTVDRLVLDGYARAHYVHHAGVPGAALAEFVAGLSGPAQLALEMVVPLLLLGAFPVGRRWRVLLAVDVAVMTCSFIGSFAGQFWHFNGPPNPYGFGGQIGSVIGGFSVIAVAGQNVGTVGAVRSVTAGLRARPGEPTLTLLRWPVRVIAAAYLSCLVLGGTSLTALVYALEHAALAISAVAAWVAVRRYRLLDGRLVLERTLRYGALTGVVVGLYAAVLAVGSTLISRRIPAIVAVAIAAVVALGVRELLQRWAARLVWGQASDPVAALTRVGLGLSALADPAAALDGAAATLGVSLRVQQVEILRSDGADLGRWRRADAIEPAGEAELDLGFGGTVVGRVRMRLAAGEATLPGRQDALLAGVAPQLGAAVQALVTAAELAASQQRLVVLKEQERIRIRRDLHDGLGPTLAGIGLGIDRARGAIREQPESAARTLEALSDVARAAVGEVRRLVHDLHPSALGEQDLAGALAIEADRLGAAVEVTDAYRVAAAGLEATTQVAAYRIALEALTNATRHSGASTITLRLDACAGSLSVEVVDDGRGLGVDLGAGIGLRSMTERAETLGGSLELAGVVPHGTWVKARLPLAQVAERDPQWV